MRPPSTSKFRKTAHKLRKNFAKMRINCAKFRKFSLKLRKNFTNLAKPCRLWKTGKASQDCRPRKVLLDRQELARLADFARFARFYKILYNLKIIQKRVSRNAFSQKKRKIEKIFENPLIFADYCVIIYIGNSLQDRGTAPVLLIIF